MKMIQLQLIQKINSLNQQILRQLDSKQSHSQLTQYAGHKLVQIDAMRNSINGQKGFQNQDRQLKKLRTIVQQILDGQACRSTKQSQQLDHYETIKGKYEQNKKHMQSLLALGSLKKPDQFEYREDYKTKYKALKSDFNNLLTVSKNLEKQLRKYEMEVQQRNQLQANLAIQNNVLKSSAQCLRKQIQYLQQALLIKEGDMANMRQQYKRLLEKVKSIEDHSRIMVQNKRQEDEIRTLRESIERNKQKLEKASKQNQQLHQNNTELIKLNKELKAQVNTTNSQLKQQKLASHREITQNKNNYRRQIEILKQQLIEKYQDQKSVLKQEIVELKEKLKSERLELEKQITLNKNTSSEIQQKNYLLQDLKELMGITQNLKQEIKKYQKQNSVLKQALNKQTQIQRNHTKSRVIDQIQDMIKIHKINMKY